MSIPPIFLENPQWEVTKLNAWIALASASVGGGGAVLAATASTDNSVTDFPDNATTTSITSAPINIPAGSHIVIGIATINISPGADNTELDLNLKDVAANVSFGSTTETWTSGQAPAVTTPVIFAIRAVTGPLTAQTYSLLVTPSGGVANAVLNDSSTILIFVI